MPSIEPGWPKTVLQALAAALLGVWGVCPPWGPLRPHLLQFNRVALPLQTMIRIRAVKNRIPGCLIMWTTNESSFFMLK
jgi:hypothetical protein